MKSNLPSVCQLSVLGLFCVIAVRESLSTYVPGRCLCPETQVGVRGQLKGLTVLPKSPSCDKYTVIVQLKRNNEQVCLDPGAPLGKQLMRCWNRANQMGRKPARTCLRRLRKGRRPRQQRNRGHNARVASARSS